MHFRWVAGLAVGLLGATLASAQNPAEQRRVDSLEQVIRTRPADSQTVNHLNELAWRYGERDPAKASRLGRQALALSRRLKFGRGEDKALTLLGIAHAVQGQFDSASLRYHEALRLRRARGDHRGEAAVLNNLGMMQYYQGDYPRATRTLLASLRLESRYGDSLSVAEGLANLAGIYSELKQYDKAIELFKRYLRIQPDTARHGSALANLCGVSVSLKKYADAVHYGERAAALCRRADDPLNEGSALINLGNARRGLQQLPQALEAHQRAVKLAELAGERHLLTTALVALGTTQLDANPRDAAGRANLERALAMARELGVREEEANTHGVLAEAWAAAGDYARAYQHERLFRQLGDTLLDERSTQQMQEARTQFETEQAEQRVRLRDLEVAEQRLIIRKRNVQLGALLAGLVASGLIGWLLLARTRLRQRVAAEQEERRQQQVRAAAVLEAEERERRRIGSDLHDTVGQLLSAAKLNLSGLQHDLQLTDPAQETLLTNALSTLDESLREVRSLSHQLVPNALLRRGLVAAVREFVDKMGGPGTMRIELEVLGLDNRLPLMVENVIYRSIQEVVANVVKHARATEVAIQLLGHPSELTVLIEDNGVGFDLPRALANPEAGIGLRNLHSRIEYLGGRLDIDSRPGRGTIVTIEVPLTAESPPEAART